MKERFLFIDRDGTLIEEPSVDFQVDSFEKYEFLPKVFEGLNTINKKGLYHFIMVTNQDGLGTHSFPEENFWPVQNHMIKSFANEGIRFDEVHIDRSFEHEGLDTRKPNTGMLKHFLTKDYDKQNSYVIGDRLTDVKLAQNLGVKSIFIYRKKDISISKYPLDERFSVAGIDKTEYSSLMLITDSWIEIAQFLTKSERIASITRKTSETDIAIEINLDGSGKAQIDTGIGFFDHMLAQIAKHGGIDLNIKVEGDLHIDEHHTVEDTAIALGEAFKKALGNKMGINRYGFLLPMDDCLARVAIDFGGRAWLIWKAEFKREKIGELPSEMFYHFFKSFSDAAQCNLNIKAKGNNEHHKIEAIFKAFAKAIKFAIAPDLKNPDVLPTTKGII